MAREHLSNDDFFTQLVTLIETTHQKGHGSVYLTQKRLTYGTSDPSPPTAKVPDDPLWDLHPPNPLPLIVRATDGKSHKLAKEEGADATGGIGRTKNGEKVKLSTVVQPESIEAFFTRYAEVCKVGMRGLRRRDRSKRKKKEKGKKKGLAEGAKP
ncbi:hypothetical protein LTR91_012980 [Friedmanniomyces endolithicus]|uniref:Signal recognition particle subunit SRP14 n=1 Tax=Friedmanniomyces endolithicus TaxID=329885 RepID=A0A4U0V386_9PEZI|nr:hypothetical protein LTS09_007211 [Friedmanniomyces endolithicus]KAK0281728.1 hypothetical protein LTR35_007409 [Friedmanniomyces endolithicus]KAK0297279.1 hypothetical protein LTS00_004000 [Friedmanniomyces endolithicus]KAK0315580.1 hypothetical protein LTR01_000880 [Friedmanniomyces endolithicus]KAK0322926.1 hypothetical protein LTR82_005854 [Friedmanniomyces endolithicus]